MTCRARPRVATTAVVLSSLMLLAACGNGEGTQIARWTLRAIYPFYFQRPPGSYTGLYRTQGIATDGTQWVFSWQYGLERANDAFVSLQRNSSFTPPDHISSGIPPDLAAQGLDHIGDIDCANGVIFASLDSAAGHYQDGHVALFNATDLTYTGTAYPLIGAPNNPHDDVASWVAVDPGRGTGYGKEWQEGNTINVYDLADWRFRHTLTISRPLRNIQGGKVRGDWLYMSADTATKTVYRAHLVTGAVEALFDLPLPAGAVELEGLALRGAPGGTVDLYVELWVDPDRSGHDPTNPNQRVDLYQYRAAREP